MYVSHKFKLLFVHIPKTGGGSIKRMIRNQDRQYRKIHRHHVPLTSKDAQKYSEYLKVVVVRNSWQLCASCYRFETQGVHKNRSCDVSFSDWLIKKEEDQKSPFPHQLQFFVDSGNVLVDKICHFETLYRDIGQMCSCVGMENTLDRFHDHYYGEYDYKRFYTKDDIDLVRRMCGEDIDYFGWRY